MSIILSKRFEEDKNRVPAPSHRHAAPSAPWPWVDIQDGQLLLMLTIHHIIIIPLPEVDPVQLASPLPPVPPLCDHVSCGGCWKGYPQSRFPNWTRDQVARSKIAEAILKRNTSTIYHVDVNSDGFFTDAGEISANDSNTEETWDRMIHTKVRKFLTCSARSCYFAVLFVLILRRPLNMDPHMSESISTASILHFTLSYASLTYADMVLIYLETQKYQSACIVR